MRPLHLSDLDTATRALLTLPEKDWALTAREFRWNAETADTYRLRHKRYHPRFGTGSLASAAAPRGVLEVGYCDARYRRAMVQILRAVEDEI